MKRYIKILILLIIIQISYMYITPNIVRAENDGEGGPPPPTISGTIKDVSPSYIDSSNYSELQTTIGYILNFLQIASGLTSVIMIAFTGFKLIFEVNPKVVKETKKTMFPIVFGIVLTFGAASIAKFIIGAVE